MKKHRMKGFIDPISVAFLLAITGTIAALTLNGSSSDEQTSQVSDVETEIVAQAENQ